MEIWKPIEGTTDAFVSTSGRISVGGVTITPQTDSEGYKRCTVAPKYRDRVHRFVAKAFCDNPGGKGYVNHINGNKADNRAGNLEWVTAKENAEAASKAGLLKGGGKKRAVAAIGNGKVAFFSSQTEAGFVLGIPAKEISKALTGKRKTAHGYRFSYDV